MTDINASLKKTIDGEPGPQHKEKGKAEFNFIEGEDGVPYSYDKKVESRLTAIEDKLDSVIENGSVNTQLTGSNVEEAIPVKQSNGVVLIHEKLGTIPEKSSKMVVVNFLEEEGLINNISFVGRNSTNLPIEIDIREAYLRSNGHWNTSQAFKKIVFSESNSTAILTDRQLTLSQSIYVYVNNKSDVDIELESLGVMFWG